MVVYLVSPNKLNKKFLCNLFGYFSDMIL